MDLSGENPESSPDTFACIQNSGLQIFKKYLDFPCKEQN